MSNDTPSFDLDHTSPEMSFVLEAELAFIKADARVSTRYQQLQNGLGGRQHENFLEFRTYLTDVFELSSLGSEGLYVAAIRDWYFKDLEKRTIGGLYQGFFCAYFGATGQRWNRLVETLAMGGMMLYAQGKPQDVITPSELISNSTDQQRLTSYLQSNPWLVTCCLVHLYAPRLKG